MTYMWIIYLNRPAVERLPLSCLSGDKTSTEVDMLTTQHRRDSACLSRHIRGFWESSLFQIWSGDDHTYSEADGPTVSTPCVILHSRSATDYTNNENTHTHVYKNTVTATSQ